MTNVPVHTKVNANLHPGKVQGDSPGAKTARDALGALYTAAVKIHDLHDVVKDKAIIHQKQVMASMPAPPKGKVKTSPPLIYDQQASAMVIDRGTPLAQAALNAADTAISSLGEQVTRLDTAINQKVTAAKNPTRGPELRAWAMKLEMPFQNLGSLFQNANDNATLVAEILGAEHYLSGISQENQSLLRTVAAGVMAPDEVQARKETSMALDHLTSAAKSFTESTAEIFNGLRSLEADAINSIMKRGAE